MKKLLPFLAMLVATTISAQQDTTVFWDTVNYIRITTPSQIKTWPPPSAYKSCKLSFCVGYDAVLSVEDSIRVNIGLLFAESVLMGKESQQGVLHFIIEQIRDPGWYKSFYRSKLLIILRLIQAQSFAEGEEKEAEEVRELTNRLFPNQ